MATKELCRTCKKLKKSKYGNYYCNDFKQNNKNKCKQYQPKNGGVI